MATNCNVDNSVLLNELNYYTQLKEEFTSKMNRKFKDWENSGEFNSDIHRLIKRMKYWCKTLREVNNVNFLVITLHQRGLQAKIDITDILLSFKQQLGISGLIGFSESKNPAFIILSFQNKQQRDFAAKNFCMVKNNFVINSDWLIDDSPSELKVLWLPPIIDIQTIHEELSKFVDLISLYAEHVDLGDGDFLNSGKFFGKFKKKNNIALDDIPHLISFEGYQSLIVIPNRQPLCLNCYTLGHVSQRCITPFCFTCQKKLPIGHTCGDLPQISSFADAVKSSKSSKISANELPPSQSLKSTSSLISLEPISNKMEKNATKNIAKILITPLETSIISVTQDSNLDSNQLNIVSNKSQEDSEDMEFTTISNKRNRDFLESSSGITNPTTQTSKISNTYSRKHNTRSLDTKVKDPFDVAVNL